jgi:hypothetical protein
MKQFIFDEMKKNIERIRSMEPKEVGSDGVYPVSKNDQMLFDTLETIKQCSMVARREGLLSLEEYSYEIDDSFPGVKYLRHMILLVVDDTDPKLLEDVCICRYCSSKLSDYSALQYLMMLVGILDIQNLENPHVIEEKLKFMLPEELSDELIRRSMVEDEVWKGRESNRSEEDDTDLSILDRVCEGEVALDQSDDYYYVVRMTDHLILEMDDRGLQRLLRDVDNADLVIAMKAISGKARRKIFNNLSKRLAVMIAEDVTHIGPIRLESAGCAARTIFSTIVRLISEGELAFNEDTVIKEMATVFLNLEDESPTPETVYDAQMAENKLYGLWNEYLSHSHKLIELPYLQ